jgi:hypothetical protein
MTFFDEHLHWMATAFDAAVPIPAGTDPGKPEDTTTTVIVFMALEAAFSSGAEEVAGTPIVFARIRINLRVVPFSGDYVLETPYRTYTFKGLVAGQRLFYRDDYGIAQAPDSFVEPRFGPIGPSLLRADSPGGGELPPLPFAGRSYAGDAGGTHPVTGSPLGKNFVRLTGPHGFVWFEDELSVTGRFKTGPIPSDINLTRASKYDAPGAVRLDVFAKGKPTLQPRLPGGTPTWKQPRMTCDPAPPLVNAVTGQLSVPTGVGGTLLRNNGPLGVSYCKQWISGGTTLPAAISGVDDAGLAASVPVISTVVVTKADYSNVTKTLTAAAATANLNSPATFRLLGVDGEVSKRTFTASI